MFKKIEAFFVKSKSWKTIIAVTSAVILLAVLAWVGEDLVYDKMLGVGLDYSNFPDNQIAIEFDAALRKSIRNDAVTRQELRVYLEERPVVVGFSESLNSRGFAQQRAGRTVVLFSSETPTRSVIKHEAYHVSLYAAGVPEARHHALMEANDWCFNQCDD